MLRAGDDAPEFSLADGNGKMRTLAEFAGKTMVLYFYPKDDTPGCTAEACGFRDIGAELAKKGAVVLGVSADDSKSHQKFISKYNLNFTLLSDSEHAACEKYGVWQEKKFMGKSYMGIVRSTFVIGKDGKLLAALYGVKPEGHAREILGLLGKQ